jgi:hypothetical protein
MLRSACDCVYCAALPRMHVLCIVHGRVVCDSVGGCRGQGSTLAPWVLPPFFEGFGARS